MTKAKILLVEDDDDLRRALTRRLRECDYEIVHAVDGLGALSTARNERPDLVLLDLGLPGGDGFSVLERYSNMSSLCGLPVVVMTGRDRRTAEPAARAFGVAGFLTKPFDNGEFLWTIERALRGQPDPAASKDALDTSAFVG